MTQSYIFLDWNQEVPKRMNYEVYDHVPIIMMNYVQYLDM